MLTLGVWYVNLLAVLFTVVCLFLILVVLIQKPKGGGLSGAFGGGGGGAQAVFGARTGDVLTWFTIVCFTVFLLLAVGLTWAIKPYDPTTTPVIESLAPPTAVPVTDEPWDNTADQSIPSDLDQTDALSDLPTGQPSPADPDAEPKPQGGVLRITEPLATDATPAVTEPQRASPQPAEPVEPQPADELVPAPEPQPEPGVEP